MQRKHYRELWEARFAKMLKLEEQSVEEYQDLLDECSSHFKGHSVIPSLERLIADEKRHAILVKELQAILSRQPQ